MCGWLVTLRMCEASKPARGAPVEATYNQVIAAEVRVLAGGAAADVGHFRLYYRSITKQRDVWRRQSQATANFVLITHQ